MTTRIKITLNEDEKKQLEEEAKSCGMTVSKYLKSFWKNRPDVELVDKESLRSYGEDAEYVRIRVPKELNNQLKAGAKACGMDKQTYVTQLLSQKGTPIEVKADLPSRQMYTQKISNLLNEVADIADTVTKSGQIYPSELRVVMDDLREAAEEFMKEAGKRDRDFSKEIDKINAQISGIRKAASK